MALIKTTFFSNCLKRHVTFNAILPVDTMFGASAPIQPLKTMYLLHGYTGSADAWLASADLVSLSNKNKLAIILPSGENHFYVDDLKSQVMYGEHVGREIVDFTRSIFPLSNKREDTIIAGISMGGYGAIRNGLKYNETFGYLIGISPALIIDTLPASSSEPNIVGVTRGYFEGVFGDLDAVVASDMNPEVLALNIKKSNSTMPDIFFSCGKNDVLVLASRKFSKTLTDNAIAHCYEESPGTHDSAFFDPSLLRALERIPLERTPSGPNPFWFDE